MSSPIFKALLRQADEADKIRSEMASKINRLEEQNKDLEVQNTLSIERNRDLLTSLETLNDSVAQADSKVRDLTADLDDTRAELDRVSARASRAEILEAQLTVLETEQDDLRRNLSLTLEDERNAAIRWQKAERQIADLQEEYDKLEAEYMQERVKTQKLATKISSRKSIRDLHFPAPKMEGAAISNFMKEILQDNQQLQAGTAELRQMLIIAQDEIGALREQEKGGSIRKVKRRTKGSKASAPTSPMPPAWAAFEQTTPTPKRPSAQSSPFSGHARTSSVPNTVFSETAPSTYRDSSIFDRSFTIDDSRPTSAGSLGPGMPISPINVEKRRGHGRNHSSFNAPTFSALNEEEYPDTHIPAESAGDSSPTEDMEQAVSEDSPQFRADSTPQNEEDEDNSDIPDAFELSTPSPFLATTIPGRRLVRSSSHESLLAPETAPMDIYMTPKGERAPIPIASSSHGVSTLQAIMTPVTAQNTPARYSSSTYNRLLLSSVGGNTPRTSVPKPQRGVGSWFWNKFGNGPKAPTLDSASSSLARHVEVTDDSSVTTVSDNGHEGSIKSPANSIKNVTHSPIKKIIRPPHMVPRKSAPVVLATPVDEESLAEVLAE
ncbi:hypothetical protein ABW20_dc0107997 [Dactylellina cionopaga]|nr:hypothetical protein ABW20_dc0107997 [Dactylellina cionopaga]